MLATLEDEATELATIDRELDLLFNATLNDYEVHWQLWGMRHIVCKEGETREASLRRYKTEKQREYRARDRARNNQPPARTAQLANYDPRCNKWIVRLTVRGARIYVGRFPTWEAAAKAREEALARLAA